VKLVIDKTKGNQRNRDISASARLIATVADYSQRKRMSVGEVERWLGQNLNYDPAE
jgi:hypothetical protein